MSEQSLINHAFNVLNSSKTPLTFKELFDNAIKASGLELNESALKAKISSLYTQLLSDSRFTLLDDKKWDLASRYSYEKTHKQYDFIDDDEDEIDEEESKLLKEELGEAEEGSDEEDGEMDYDNPKKEDDEF